MRNKKHLSKAMSSESDHFISLQAWIDFILVHVRAGIDHDMSRCEPMHPYTSTFMCRLPNHSLGQKRTKRAVMFRFRKCFVTVLVRAALVNIYGKKKHYIYYSGSLSGQLLFTCNILAVQFLALRVNKKRPHSLPC